MFLYESAKFVALRQLNDRKLLLSVKYKRIPKLKSWQRKLQCVYVLFSYLKIL